MNNSNLRWSERKHAILPQQKKLNIYIAHCSICKKTQNEVSKFFNAWQIYLMCTGRFFFNFPSNSSWNGFLTHPSNSQANVHQHSAIISWVSVSPAQHQQQQYYSISIRTFELWSVHAINKICFKINTNILYFIEGTDGLNVLLLWVSGMSVAVSPTPISRNSILIIISHFILNWNQSQTSENDPAITEIFENLIFFSRNPCDDSQ